MRRKAKMWCRLGLISPILALESSSFDRNPSLIRLKRPKGLVGEPGELRCQSKNQEHKASDNDAERSDKRGWANVAYRVGDLAGKRNGLDYGWQNHIARSRRDLGFS
jgi:hypothetical protein